MQTEAACSLPQYGQSEACGKGFQAASSLAHPSGDARESASRRLPFSSASRPFPGPLRTLGLQEPRCPWGPPVTIMTGLHPKPWPPQPAEPRPPLPRDVYMGCTRDAPGMHTRQPLVHRLSIPGTPHVHGARQWGAAPGEAAGLAGDVARAASAPAWSSKLP
jgi:hypothetical protein